jgi:hypothetical protein
LQFTIQFNPDFTLLLVSFLAYLQADVPFTDTHSPAEQRL